jgi:hypothetical protein
MFVEVPPPCDHLRHHLRDATVYFIVAGFLKRRLLRGAARRDGREDENRERRGAPDGNDRSTHHDIESAGEV